MRYIIIAVIVLGAILGGIALKPSATEYVAQEVQVVEREVVKEINPLDEQIRQREAELEEKYRSIQALEARRDVLMRERDRLDAEITTVTKELAGFMIATTSKR